MEDIGFFFEYNGTVVQLPVNPGKVTIDYGAKNSSVDIINLGEISLLNKGKLSKVTFESFFPEAQWFPAIRTNGKFERATFYDTFFRKIIDDAKPCRFIVTGVGINMLASIEMYKPYHQAGDHEDKYFSIELKQYRVHSIIKLPTVAQTQTVVVPTPSAPRESTLAPQAIVIGCDVILNGRVHYDSYGSKPGRTFTNYKGKVNFTNLKGSHPYHITTPDGGWLGWVLKECIVRV